MKIDQSTLHAELFGYTGIDGIFVTGKIHKFKSISQLQIHKSTNPKLLKRIKLHFKLN